MKEKKMGILCVPGLQIIHIRSSAALCDCLCLALSILGKLGRHLSQPPTGMLAPHQPFLTNPPSSSSSEGKLSSAALAAIWIGEETQISSKVENGRRGVNYSHNKTCDRYAPSTRHNFAPRADRKGINILEGSLRKTLKHIQPYRKIVFRLDACS
jgi:hypothetical protein